ncbi:MAG: SPOR domain-containing protein, partial [Bryobacteraceae bacterium]
LPFDAWVRVKNLDHDDRAVEVRITDRGPFVKGRILDLSRAAASRIGMIGPGTARVRLEVIRAPDNAQAAAVFAVQVGAFEDRANAESLSRRLQSRYGPVSIVERPGDPALFRVLAGRARSEAEAEALAGRLRDREKLDGFVTRLD